MDQIGELSVFLSRRLYFVQPRYFVPAGNRTLLLGASMLDADAAAILARVLAETRSGRLKWERDADDYFRADVGVNAQPILIRRIFIEATNQCGADPYFVEFSMAGWNARFTITEDSEGWRMVRQILEAAFPGGWLPDAKQALAQLELKLGQDNPAS